MRILGTDIFLVSSFAQTRATGSTNPVQSGGEALGSDIRSELNSPVAPSFTGKPTDFFNKPVGSSDFEVRVPRPPVVDPPVPPASKASIKEKLSIMLESLSVAINTSRVGMSESLTSERRMELTEVGRFFLGRASAISAMDMDRLFEILGNLSNESKAGIREGFSLMANFDFDISNKMKAGASFDTLNRILSLLDPIAECFRSPAPTPAPAPAPAPAPTPAPTPTPPPIVSPGFHGGFPFPRPVMPLIPYKIQLLGQPAAVFSRLA